MKTVLIAIQARSGSTRLPRKAFAIIGNKMMMDCVIDACRRSATYLNERLPGVKAMVAVLTPEGDQIARSFADRCPIYQGPELDVLERYRGAAETFEADLVVRITGDCPLIPAWTVTKHVTLALSEGYDYLSNVDPRFRTAVDGTDCEVVSARLLREAAARAKEAADREHVTTWIRREPPEWAKVGVVVNYFDHSSEKLSVDTPEDLERVREAFARAHDKYREATMLYGRKAVHLV